MARNWETALPPLLAGRATPEIDPPLVVTVGPEARTAARHKAVEMMRLIVRSSTNLNPFLLCTNDFCTPSPHTRGRKPHGHICSFRISGRPVKPPQSR
jgi:hypothetical protein